MNNPFFGNIQAPVDGSFDMNTQNIPDGTIAKALIEEAKWESYTPLEGTNAGIEQTFIKCTWAIVEGDFSGRKVFQKMHVQDQDQSKAQRALQMLAAIDANAGGKVMAAGTIPDDMMLGVSITNIPMMITINEWSIGNNSGNYVSAVSRAQAPVQVMSQGQAINQAVNNVQNQPVQQQAQPQQMQQQPVQQQAQQQQQVQYADQQPQQMNAQQLQASDIDF